MFTRYLAPLILLLTGCVSTNTSQESVDYSLPIAAIGFWSGSATEKEVINVEIQTTTKSWSGFVSESGMVILTKNDGEIIYGDLDWNADGEAAGTLYYHANGTRHSLDSKLTISESQFRGTIKSNLDTSNIYVDVSFTMSLDNTKNSSFRQDVDYYDLDGRWYEYVGSSSNAVNLSDGDSTIRAIESNCTIKLETQTNLYRYAEFYLNADLSNCVDSSHNGSYTGYMQQTQDETYTYLDAYLFNASAIHHVQLRQ
ncbi:hypothetical protein FJM67_06845 [Maribrevibacterium harenarium]|uniref:Uncharacterized protein n=1 Tax=Maribrevibacterium harenarium TaxID=2589817 RepID=A0A501X191_9GAMM|nr:hypothetical protein [Maribrevibacterium harenarium]TPE53366.1 hypothetical protein FJM67_06845 [Maribrevibacterium harenarium]